MDITVYGAVISEQGNDWFLFDVSGAFSLDCDVMATVWLVGGGYDGGNGYLDGNNAHGGDGGNGGKVYKFGKVKLLKNTEYRFSVGKCDGGVSSFELGSRIISTDMLGYTQTFGGRGGIINSNAGIVSPRPGTNGVITPYGYVGSSGCGGVCGEEVNGIYRSTSMSRGGIGSGSSEYRGMKVSDAENYGCGGDGDYFCGSSDKPPDKSHGKDGCVIIQYEIVDETLPECTIKFWDKNSVNTTV